MVGVGNENSQNAVNCYDRGNRATDVRGANSNQLEQPRSLADAVLQIQKQLAAMPPLALFPGNYLPVINKICALIFKYPYPDSVLLLKQDHWLQADNDMATYVRTYKVIEQLLNKVVTLLHNKTDENALNNMMPALKLMEVCYYYYPRLTPDDIDKLGPVYQQCGESFITAINSWSEKVSASSAPFHNFESYARSLSGQITTIIDEVDDLDRLAEHADAIEQHVEFISELVQQTQVNAQEALNQVNNAAARLRGIINFRLPAPAAEVGGVVLSGAVHNPANDLDHN